ncbi:unnamed protein product [Darwinula stevensoni]|uniref:RRM domain-containing protein n=1 Tax=Darwinula stevensoni TaxID=69355 RepID=A0A7R8ZXE8_9CRUS|nr:unnamed protein product [Darwinula stevensoni]CAG0879199.1 unnamed protein product [Darwinula stevensoni]
MASAVASNDISMEEVKVMDVKEEPMDQSEVSEELQKWIDAGLDPQVAEKVEEICKSGKLDHSDLDERALEALKEFPISGAIAVLKQFEDSNLDHVSNKSAYLCGVMKTYRQKSKSSPGQPPTGMKGPDEEKINAILERTGYKLDVTTGQRKYGHPSQEMDEPGSGCEVFCGKIPKDVFEDELIPLFEKCGTIHNLRLMMDPMTGTNRGFCFVTFTSRSAAQQAVKEVCNFLFCGLFSSKNHFIDERDSEGHEAGLIDAIIYSSPDDRKKNRGFCFLEYDSHKSASLAKRRLSSGRIKVWGCDIIVDWADPQEEPDQEIMSKVKVLYVRNLTQKASEDDLKETFERFGAIERVKKIKDYAFIHFSDREDAIKAMEELQGKDLGGAPIEISLAKPPSDKRKKEEVLRKREVRMMQMMSSRGGLLIPPGGMRGGRGSLLRNPLGRGDYDYDYDYYGYCDYRGGYSDPYYDDFYRYDDYYDYPPPPAPMPPPPPPSALPRGRGLPPPMGRGGRGGTMGGGRGMGGGGPMGGPGAPPPPPSPTMRGRGHMRGQAPRGSPRGRGFPPGIAGKRKLDTNQNQGDSKRRSQPPTGNHLSNGGSTNEPFYADSFGQQWN